MNVSRLSPTALAHEHALDTRLLPHERLDVFRVAIELVELVTTLGNLRSTASASSRSRAAQRSKVLPRCACSWRSVLSITPATAPAARCASGSTRC